jgi:SAM-dependent methyltransferase
MMQDQKGQFDAGAYWRSRVVSGSDLAVVGHRSMGRAYNGQIYERRLEVLDALVGKYAMKPFEELRVLDIGCGSGFYTGYWLALGVKSYVGLDISEATIRHLSGQYPDYDFVRADVTDEQLEAFPDLAQFDVVTVFDVFYHIVDDKRFANAVRHIALLTGKSGVVLIMDQLYPDRYQLSKHVVYRERQGYLGLFGQFGFDLVENELLFHYLVPPLSGYRLFDYAVAGVFKVVGVVVRVSDRLADRLARRLRRLDQRLRKAGKEVSNSEMLVFRK